MKTTEEQLRHAQHVVDLIGKVQKVLEGNTAADVFDVGLFLVSNVALQVGMPEEELLDRCKEGRKLAIELHEKTAGKASAS